MKTQIFSALFLAAAVLYGRPTTCTGDDRVAKPYGIDVRTEWIGSRVIGSPEPPLPYIPTEAFSRIKWDRPIYAKPEPGTRNLLVIQQGGERNQPAKLLRINDRPDVSEASLLLEIPERLVYGLEFHPNYRQNGYVYLFSNGPTGLPERKNRVSRFTVSRDSQADLSCDLDSERIIIEWRSMGHDGGDLVFGHDGMLYVTSGDGTSDSDTWLSAQDVTNLLGGVLRVDVDRPTADAAYAIPADNPFLDISGARGELWAIGLRNPWRMTVDANTGQIWVGNNGQDLWETVNLIRRGENYGWSVYEGSHPFYTHREIGPGKLTPPTFEHHHTEARSLTGGIVYNGDRHPDLKGAYVYGDYSTGKIWAARHDGTKVTWHREIADTSLQIAGFSNSHQGELLIVDHAGGIFRLVENPKSLRPDDQPAFPRKLSETGLFASVSRHQVAPGVIPYSVNAPAWNDGAAAERFIAIPGNQTISYAEERGWNLPEGSVLLQTLSLNANTREAFEKRRIETRILTRQQGEWSGYSYRWNAEQDDALLVERGGMDIVLGDAVVGLADDKPWQTSWRIPSRAECMSCHSRAVNFVLGISELQLNRSHHYESLSDNQLRTFEHIGLFSSPLSKPAKQRKKLVNPHDESEAVEARAKSYLHVNCSSCHVSAGGGNARMELEFTTSVEKMEVVSHFPQHNTFGIAQPLIIAPGDPDRSVMLARITRRGLGQMPPLVSQQVDKRGAELIRQWILALESDRKFIKAWTVNDLQDHLPEARTGRSFERGRQSIHSAGCVQCHRIRDEKAGIGPNLSGISSRMKIDEILESIVSPSATIAEKYAQTVVVTSDGEVVQGRVEMEDDQVVVLRGGESTAMPRSIQKSDMERRGFSKVSMMPAGTINHLELDEVLDLMAYILADGDPEHEVFSASP